jgi:nucleoid-associated protein YgaU
MQHAPIYREPRTRIPRRAGTHSRLASLVIGVVALALMAPGLGRGFAASTPAPDDEPPIVADADRHSVGAALSRAVPSPSAGPATAPVARDEPAQEGTAAARDAVRRARYVVREGDTLSDIADLLGTSVEALMEANAIDDPDLLYEGEVLLVPSDRDGS